VAKGIKSFKKGMSEEEAEAPAPAQDPFRREEPRALDTAATPASQPGSTQSASTPQPNKAS
jgi:Sec-independent protein translocase protein TatA